MPHKLILADPSPSVQKAVRLAFADPEFEVLVIEDGLRAIEELTQTKPDAVLLSPVLPTRDGYEVGRFLRGREELKKVALILLKNAFEPLDGERLNGLDCDGIVQKPFDSERLVRLVHESIDRRRVPPSFPEEGLIDEGPPASDLPLFQDEEFMPPPLPSRSTEGFESQVRGILREEILAVERELEKRLKASLRADLKEWLEKQKE